MSSNACTTVMTKVINLSTFLFIFIYANFLLKKVLWFFSLSSIKRIGLGFYFVSAQKRNSELEFFNLLPKLFRVISRNEIFMSFDWTLKIDYFQFIQGLCWGIQMVFICRCICFVLFAGLSIFGLRNWWVYRFLEIIWIKY